MQYVYLNAVRINIHTNAQRTVNILVNKIIIMIIVVMMMMMMMM